MKSLKYLVVYLLVIAAAVYAVTMIAPAPYVVRKDYTDLSVVEILDPDGKPTDMKRIEDLKDRGLHYTIVWVAPSSMR